MKHCMTRPGQLDVHVLQLHVHVVLLVNVHNGQELREVSISKNKLILLLFKNVVLL